MRIKNERILALTVLVSLILMFVVLSSQVIACGPGEAVGGNPVTICESLTAFSYPGTTIISATLAPADTVVVPSNMANYGFGLSMPEHCVVKGKMNERVSPEDTKTYSIGFEMRLPTDWKGRFFYQANGGIDGSIVPAFGGILGGAPTSNGLVKGFAVISSDAGHPGSMGPFFGIDPQARIDYGYNAVAELTPMAKRLIKAYYGKLPDKSYFAGCSNGGRHAMVAASRYADQYDGILAGSPGFNLPKAAVAQLWGAQQFATISALGTNGRPDISTSFSAADMTLVGNKILGKCDALDGLVDDMVSDPMACQTKFKIASDVPTCAGIPDGTCLTQEQKNVLAAIFKGAKNSAGKSLYTKFLWDAGVMGKDWRTWKFGNSLTRDPGAVAFIFTTPPQNPSGFNDLEYALNWNGAGFDPDRDAPKIFATNATYRESAMFFMTPPNLTMSGLIRHNAKLMVMHGVSDGVFSPADTIKWYENFQDKWGHRANDTARLFLVPQMSHCSGGPSCDQFDMLDALVKWVEKGKAPDSIVAKARGTGVNANVVNPEVPATWVQDRTRLLCPYPAVAEYRRGPIDDAASFKCVFPRRLYH